MRASEKSRYCVLKQLWRSEYEIIAHKNMPLGNAYGHRVMKLILIENQASLPWH